MKAGLHEASRPEETSRTKRLAAGVHSDARRESRLRLDRTSALSTHAEHEKDGAVLHLTLRLAPASERFQLFGSYGAVAEARGGRRFNVGVEVRVDEYVPNSLCALALAREHAHKSEAALDLKDEVVARFVIQCHLQSAPPFVCAELSTRVVVDAPRKSGLLSARPWKKLYEGLWAEEGLLLRARRGRRRYARGDRAPLQAPRAQAPPRPRRRRGGDEGSQRGLAS